MYRFTSSGTQHQGELVVRTNSSHGVRLDGGSTGGIVESYGDDTSISLTVRAKGVGILTLGRSTAVTEVVGSTVTIGTSTSPVLIQGSSVTIGVSTSPVRILASSVYLNSTQIRVGSTVSSIVIGNSTSYLTGLQRYLIDASTIIIPVIAASQALDATYTVTGLSTASGVVFNMQGAAMSTAYRIVGVRCSTTDQLTVRWVNGGSTIGSAGTTMSFRVTEFKF